MSALHDTFWCGIHNRLTAPAAKTDFVSHNKSRQVGMYWNVLLAGVRLLSRICSGAWFDLCDDLCCDKTSVVTQLQHRPTHKQYNTHGQMLASNLL